MTSLPAVAELVHDLGLLPHLPYSLVGCTVAPGFEFTRFELGRRDVLLAQFPAAADAVMQLTTVTRT